MKMKTDSADWRGLWAVTWRSLLFLPAALAAFVGLALLACAMLFTPLIAWAFFYLGRPGSGLGMLFFWLALLWAWRHFRLGRLYEAPPSLL
jgi:hypothetical protein